MTQTTDDISTMSDREIVATRTFDARRELVFQMWTDPKHLAHWWGPKGFSVTIHEMDVRPGGVWRFIMHGPDGNDYPNEIVYREVLQPQRLVYDHLNPAFRMTVTFQEQSGQTKVTARMLFESATLREKVAAAYHAVEGLHQTLERLAEELVQMHDHADQEFVITRVFDAPRDLVWKALTEPQRLLHWWGPKGFNMRACKVDLRPGGVFHYRMRAPNGADMWGQWVYREIVPPERLVFVTSFSDEAANITRSPFNAAWPLEILNVVTFTEQAGKTTISIRGGPINATEEERAIFHAARGSMEKGFSGTFDQLDAYLASLPGGDRS